MSVLTEVRGGAGLVTLDRPKALNALSLPMIRELTAALLSWRDDAHVQCVAVRGQGREGPFGNFCAGGDIRFFHEVATAGGVALEDFFTEEYELNHLIHTYPKPYAVFLDGVVFGGGMGISGHGRNGRGLRIVTERTKMAMPETNIGLFPDVGGGWFLSRCPGRLGEYLALTGQVFSGADALAAGLADAGVDSSQLPSLWELLTQDGFEAVEAASRIAGSETKPPQPSLPQAPIERFFGLDSIAAIVSALEGDAAPWAQETAAVLRKRSPLMLHVTLEQVRRARAMTLADALRLERGMMRHCFHRDGAIASETVEGIRALVIDKDQAPQWKPARIEDVTPEMVAEFFRSPWPAHAHPLRRLDAGR